MAGEVGGSPVLTSSEVTCGTRAGLWIYMEGVGVLVTLTRGFVGMLER